MEDGVPEVAPPILRYWEKFYNGAIDHYLQIHNDLDTHQVDQPPGVCCVLGYWKKVPWETPTTTYEYIRTGSHQILDTWARRQNIIMPEYIAVNSQSKKKELLIMDKLGRAESCPEEGRMAPPLALTRLRRMHAGTHGICVVFHAKTPRQIIPLPICWRCGLQNQENEQLRFCSRKCQRWVCTSHTCWIGDDYVSCVDCALEAVQSVQESPQRIMRLYELSHATHKPEQIGELRLPQEVAAAFHDGDMEVLNNSHMRLVMERMGRQYPCFVPKRFRGLEWTSGIIGYMTCQVPWGRIRGRTSIQVRDPVYSLPQPTDADLGRGDHNTARPPGAYPVPELGDEWRRTFYRLEREILGPDLTVDMPKRFLRGPLGILPDWPPGENDQYYLPMQVLRSNGPWIPAEWTMIGVWRMSRFMLDRHDQQRVHHYGVGELMTRFPNLIPKEYNIHGRRTTAMDQEAVCVM